MAVSRRTVYLIVLAGCVGIEVQQAQSGDWLFRDLGALDSDELGSESLSIRRNEVVGKSQWRGSSSWRAWHHTIDPDWFDVDSINDISPEIIRWYRDNLADPPDTFHPSDRDDVVPRAVFRGKIVGTIAVSLETAIVSLETGTPIPVIGIQKQLRSWVCFSPPQGSGTVTRVMDLGQLFPQHDPAIAHLLMRDIDHDGNVVGSAFAPGGFEHAVWVHAHILDGTHGPVTRMSSATGENSRAFAIAEGRWAVGSSGNWNSPTAVCWKGDLTTYETLPVVSEQHGDEFAEFNPGLADEPEDETELVPSHDTISEAKSIVRRIDDNPDDIQYAIVGYSGRRAESDVTHCRDGDAIRPVVWLATYDEDGTITYTVYDPVFTMFTAFRGSYTTEEARDRLPESGHGVFLDVEPTKGEAVGWIRTGSYEFPEEDTRAIYWGGPASCGIECGSEYHVIQETAHVVWEDDPAQEIGEPATGDSPAVGRGTWTLLSANGINRDGNIVGVARHNESGKKHAYLLRRERLGGTAKSASMWRNGMEGKYIGRNMRFIACGPRYNLALRHGRVDARVQTPPRKVTSNVVVLDGKGAVVNDLAKLHAEVSFVLAGKRGDWAVAEWGGSLHLVGDFKAVGAHQGFGRSVQFSANRGGGTEQTRATYQHRNRRFIDGDTRADGAIFLGFDGCPFVFGKDNGTGEHALPACLERTRASAVAAGLRFNCLIRQGTGELVAWGCDKGFPISDLAKTGLFANRNSGVPVVKVAATDEGIVALAKDGKVHVFGRAHGASPGKPTVLSCSDLGLPKGTKVLDVKAFPRTDYWAVKGSDGYVYLRGTKIDGRKKFYSPTDFFPAFGADALFTAAPTPKRDSADRRVKSLKLDSGSRRDAS